VNERLPARPAVGPLAKRLARHAHAARGAYSSNTERALRSDTAIFTAWCEERGAESLPAAADLVAKFIDAMAETKSPATVRRYVSSIATFHRAAGADNPTTDETVRLALRRMAKANGTRQSQAAPLNRPAVDRMLRATGDRLIDLRNKALLSAAYDTLCRRSELVAFDVTDLSVSDDGTGTLLIRRSKTDTEGSGTIRFIAVDTLRMLSAWLAGASIEGGALFRAVGKGDAVGGRLDAGDVGRIFRDMAERAHIDTKGVSGHSTRVGAAQDMVAAGLELPEVMQAGGWKTPTMPARYTERLAARRSAAAKLAAMQDRL
jgi:site-specific recombinase XerD